MILKMHWLKWLQQQEDRYRGPKSGETDMELCKISRLVGVEQMPGAPGVFEERSACVCVKVWFGFFSVRVAQRV